jgi:PAS domain S-box-containing protein
MQVSKIVPFSTNDADDMFRSLADALPQFVWMTRPDGYVEYFNSPWYDYTGLTHDQSLGTNLWQHVFHPDDYARIEERWNHSLKTGEVYEIEYRIRGRDGKFRWFLGRGIPMHDDNGAITKWFGTCTDIHDRITATTELRDAIEFSRSVLESSTDGIKVLDPQGRILSMNLSGREHFGLEDEHSYLMKDWTGFWQDAARIKAAQAVQEALAGRTSQFEGFRPTLRGRPKWWEVIVTPIADSTGAIHRILVVSRDMTERQQHENELRLLADALPQIVWMAKPDGRHDYYNKRWYDYTGRSTEDSVGIARWPVMHPADDEACWLHWQESLRTGQHYEFEYRLRRHDGEYRWFLGRGVPVRDESGTITKWFGTCTDIHDKVVSEHAMKQAIEQADAASMAKSEFLANMSHEIRTPMNAVVGLTNILSLSKPLTDKQREFIATLQVSAEQLLQLINDLLDMSRLESNGMHLEAIPFDLNKLVSEVLSINDVRAREKHITLEQRGQCNSPLVGDPLRMKQIIMNLVGNAVKFTADGSVSVNLFCKPHTAGSLVDVMIAVEDTGIGIAPDQVGSIFGKFSQADTSTARRYGGSGLGLSIAKTLTELMGGQITVNSRPGKGSCFTVTLTLPSVKINESETSPVKEKAAVENAPAKKDAAPFKVLLVEDYHANVLVATLLLQNFGYEYELASSGEEALQKLEEEPFGLVLMDVQMPQMNGYQATAIIREREAARGGRRMPIIGMTAHALKGDRERCIDAGMDDYISKPFRPENLKATIDRYRDASNENPAA